MKVDLNPQLDALTERIIGARFAVANTLGHGFAEPVYRNALFVELESHHLEVEIEKRFLVHYRNQPASIWPTSSSRHGSSSR